MPTDATPAGIDDAYGLGLPGATALTPTGPAAADAIEEILRGPELAHDRGAADHLPVGRTTATSAACRANACAGIDDASGRP